MAALPADPGGDFNADPDSDEIRCVVDRPIASAEARVPRRVAWPAGLRLQRHGATWTNANPYARLDLEPDRRIDYVFVGWPKAGGAGHVTRCTVEGLEPSTASSPATTSPSLTAVRAASGHSERADPDGDQAARVFADLAEGVAEGDPQAAGDGRG